MKTLHIVIIVLFTITVFMAGLITTFNAFRESARIDDLRDISRNPTKYLNKEIDVVGNIYKPMVLFDYREDGIRYAISKEDKEGFYTIFLNTYNGEWVEPGTYRFKGIIKSVNVCICDYRCVDYFENCVYIHDYLYMPNLTIRNFRTNLTTSPIKNFWYPNYYYYSKIIDYLCPVNTKDYFECSYEMKKEFNPFSLEWQRFSGVFYKEYACRPNSTETAYFIEAITPMAKI